MGGQGPAVLGRSRWLCQGAGSLLSGSAWGLVGPESHTMFGVPQELIELLPLDSAPSSVLSNSVVAMCNLRYQDLPPGSPHPGSAHTQSQESLCLPGHLPAVAVPSFGGGGMWRGWSLPLCRAGNFTDPSQVTPLLGPTVSILANPCLVPHSFMPMLVPGPALPWKVEYWFLSPTSELQPAQDPELESHSCRPPCPVCHRGHGQGPSHTGRSLPYSSVPGAGVASGPCSLSSLELLK